MKDYQFPNESTYVSMEMQNIHLLLIGENLSQNNKKKTIVSNGEDCYSTEVY